MADGEFEGGSDTEDDYEDEGEGEGDYKGEGGVCPPRPIIGGIGGGGT